MDSERLVFIRRSRHESESIYVEPADRLHTGQVVIPVAEIIYPDGTRLEGKGLKPGVLVRQRRSDLLNGVDSQLQAAIDFLAQ